MKKSKAFRRVLRVTGLPNGKVAYFHATKGLRNRKPTPQLLTALVLRAGQ